MRHDTKKAIRAIAEAKQPRMNQEVYDAFFNSPCWIALKQAAIQGLDSAADIVFASNDIIEIQRMRGVMQGLMFIIDSRENLTRLISDNMDVVAEVSSCLKTAITELEKENGRNKPND
ncbi:MAG TPA: hypothetical protein PLG04_00655 [Anaerolineaceae bacterium]|jgi:hypothetical protein|nr:MAG: hypothetical protein BWY95_00641 [Bacteroidetes bacterium ADurb.BinA104]HOR77300.1 hypothetical protein [Anaerolineaceae bacterium]